MDTQLATGSEPKLTRRRRGVRLRGAGRQTRPAQASSLSGEWSPLDVQPKSLDLHALAAQWQRALDADEFALRAAVDTLPASYLSRRRRELTQERQETAALLKSVARTRGVRPLPWLSSGPVTKQMLGLTTANQACLFDLDGVLTDSALLHAAAWAQILDELLLRLTASAGWHFIPFDPDVDYRTYIEGRSRLEGIHSFLESRGIRLPEGRIDGPPDADTAQGLAKRKGEALARDLLQRGVTARPGAHRYLDAAGRAGLGRAVISASASTLPMLELAGLAGLVEACMDADVIHGENIRTAPSPELLLAACRHLDVRPQDAVTFTHSASGVVAGLAAGMTVVGVGQGSAAGLLCDYGAQRVIPSLSTLLGSSLTGGDANAR